jgi:hypothetical protein
MNLFILSGYEISRSEVSLRSKYPRSGGLPGLGFFDSVLRMTRALESRCFFLNSLPGFRYVPCLRVFLSDTES